MVTTQEDRIISSDFSLQSAQASGEHSVVYRTIGLTEAHRFLAQVALRRWQTWPCQEEESEKRKWWCRTRRGRRLKYSLLLYRHLLSQ